MDNEIQDLLSRLGMERADLVGLRKGVDEPLKRWAREPHRDELRKALARSLSNLFDAQSEYEETVEALIRRLVDAQEADHGA
jgi:hypothetical protein